MQTEFSLANFLWNMKKGNDVYEKSSQFVCSNSAPKLNVVTAPEFFSPDNDGTDDDLFIKLSANVFC